VRLAAREAELDGRERQIEAAARETAEAKRAFEHRAIQVSELERRAQLGVASVEEREAELEAARAELERGSAELAEREEKLALRKDEFNSYIRRVQGSFYSDR
jgi:hypothetical protein